MDYLEHEISQTLLLVSRKQEGLTEPVPALLKRQIEGVEVGEAREPFKSRVLGFFEDEVASPERLIILVVDVVPSFNQQLDPDLDPRVVLEESLVFKILQEVDLGLVSGT